MATLKLYYTDQNEGIPAVNRHWELIPNNLFIVDDIVAYLATKSYQTISNFQYMKNEMEISITLDASQLGSQPRDMQYRYISIQNEGESNIYYYFVKNVMWRSKSAVRLELVMDVLNTFKEGTDYNFKENTKIAREHKDRYTYTKSMTCGIDYQILSSAGSLAEGDRVVLTNDRGEDVFVGTIIYIDQYYANIQIENPTSEEEYIELIEPYLGDRFDLSKVDAGANYISFEPETLQDFNFQTTYNYYSKIDFVSEGINPMLIRKEEGSNVQDSGVLKQNWYLLYRNANDPDPNELVNPVECYLIPQEETKTDAAYISGGRLVPSWLEESKWYVFIISSTQTATLSNGATISRANDYRTLLLLTKAGNKINATALRVNTNGAPYVTTFIWQYDDINYVNFSLIPAEYNVMNSFTNVTGNDLIAMSFPNNFTNSDDKMVIDGIANLDRADAKNIKCIKLPYCPFRLSYVGDTLSIEGSTDWERASFTQSQGGNFYALHLINNSIKLENEISASSLTPFSNLKVSLTDIREDETRDTDAFDPKLLHSDFYSPSYVYDSFSMKIDLEKCDLDWYIDNGVSANKIKFTMTSTINSKFMFTFVNYHSNKSLSNFYNVMPIARNNEVVLYNVPYINYIRTGYNYDIKNKNITNASNFIGLGLSAASMAAALAVPTAPLKVAAVAGALISMAMSVKNTIVSTYQNEESIKQKLNQTANQAASVAGSDDVDLMSEYCDNRLKYMVYEPTDVMKNLLNDLFFYAGYKSDRMGLPNHNTRCNFDYLECDASFENLGSIPNDCLNELVNAFKMGVTYLHKSSRTIDKWDFKQEYENWENSLLER